MQQLFHSNSNCLSLTLCIVSQNVIEIYVFQNSHIANQSIVLSVHNEIIFNYYLSFYLFNVQSQVVVKIMCLITFHGMVRFGSIYNYLHEYSSDQLSFSAYCITDWMKLGQLCWHDLYLSVPSGKYTNTEWQKQLLFGWCGRFKFIHLSTILHVLFCK